MPELLFYISSSSAARTVRLLMPISSATMHRWQGLRGSSTGVKCAVVTCWPPVTTASYRRRSSQVSRASSCCGSTPRDRLHQGTTYHNFYCFQTVFCFLLFKIVMYFFVTYRYMYLFQFVSVKLNKCHHSSVTDRALQNRLTIEQNPEKKYEKCNQQKKRSDALDDVSLSQLHALLERYLAWILR